MMAWHDFGVLTDLQAYDRRAFLHLYGAGEHGWLWTTMVFLTMVGSGWSLLAIFPFVIRHRSRHLAAWLIGTLLGTALIVAVLKWLVHRPRPTHTLAGVVPLFGNPHDYSFPSGHAAGSFAFAAFLLVVAAHLPMKKPVRSVIAVGLLCSATGIALSRVFLGVHFPVDVTAGALLGAGLGTVGALAHNRAAARSKGLHDPARAIKGSAP